MRLTLALGLSSILCTSACFQDPSPVEDGGTAASTTAECVDGTEGCPCIEGACINELSCLSNVCVNADGTSSGSAGPGTNPTSTATSTATSTDDGVGTTPPTATDTQGGIPPGEPCDPVFDLCEPEVSCIGASLDGFFCEFPGPIGEGEPCESANDCGYHLICTGAQAFDECMSNIGCCTTFCDLFDPDPFAYCGDGYFCEPYYLDEPGPAGYEHVGICVQNPS